MNTLLKTALAKETLLACKGYDARFLTPDLELGIDQLLRPAQRKLLPKVEGNRKRQLHYTGLTVLYNAERRLPFVAAYNIDGNLKVDGVKRAGSFSPDPRMDASLQLSQEGFYDLRKDITEFEIGHMAANNELAWGQQAQLQSYQTFHYPNSAPQAERLNSGIWKLLESYIISEAGSSKASRRISVFTGPVLRADDPPYVKDPQFRIPLLFYKLVLFRSRQGVHATAFVMSHEKKMREQGMFLMPKTGAVEKAGGLFDDFPYRKVFQLSVPMLEELTGMRFRWKGVQTIAVPEDRGRLLRIRRVSDAADAKKEQEALGKGLRSTQEKRPELAFRLNMIL